MTKIPPELAASWQPKTEWSTPKRIMDLMVHCAVHGVFRYSLRSIIDVVGMNRTTVQHVIKQFRDAEAIVVIVPARGSAVPVYRIMKPDWTPAGDMRRWSPERIEIMTRMWPDHDTPSVLAAINALPGVEVSERGAREYAARKGLRRSRDWRVSFHSEVFSRMNAEKARQARLNPKPKAPRNQSKPVSEQAPRPAPYSATITGRLGSSVTLRLPGLRAGPQTVWHPGACQWPLTCHEPASGRFCQDHGGMVRTRKTRDDQMEAAE